MTALPPPTPAADAARRTLFLAWLTRGLLGVAGLLFVGHAVAFAPQLAKLPGQFDFTVYARAGRALAAGTPLYDVGFNGCPYVYPPAFAAMFRFCALMPMRVASWIWLSIDLACLGVSLRLLLPFGRFSTRSRAAAAALLIALSPPVLRTLALGQINLVLLLLLSLALALSKRPRPSVATESLVGALLGVAVMIKVYPAVYALALANGRRHRALMAMGTTLVALGLFGVAFGGGWENTRLYVFQILPNMSARLGDMRVYPENQSLAAVLARSFRLHDFELSYRGDAISRRVSPYRQSPQIARIGTLAGAVLIGIGTFVAVRRHRRRGNEREGFAADCAVLTAAVLLVSPVVWDHYYVMLAIPALIVWGNASPRSSALRLGVAGVALFVGAQSFWAVPLAIHPSPVVTMLGFTAVTLMWGAALGLCAGAPVKKSRGIQLVVNRAVETRGEGNGLAVAPSRVTSATT